MHNYIYGDHNGTKPPRGRALTRVLVAVLALVIVVELCVMMVELRARRGQSPVAPVIEIVEKTGAEAGTERTGAEMGKRDLAGLIGSRPLEADQQILEITDQSGNVLYVRTTLLPELQALADKWLQSSRAHQAALVVMNPDTGEVLAMAGYSADGQEGNTALAGSFPAASLFKIVTAAAAVEKAEMSAESKLAYDGGKHTLYKNNLAKEPDKGRNSVTLQESFADSINTVFGKLGVFTLGPEELAEFAGRFGFNTDINFEMPVEASNFAVDDQPDDFRLAELASGFNRETKVSPLHGALMAASVVSGGRLREPTLVREVFDRNNHIYYQSDPGELREIISPATAEELSRLMRSAVEEGTGRRTFGSASTHPVLSRLVIGGKSGTINNEDGQRVDWFVAWAKPRPGLGCEDKLAVSAVVVHNWTAVTTSQRLVRDALNAYYKDKLGQRRPSGASSSRAARGGSGG